MAFSIKFNEEKNQLLKATRNISFEDVLEAMQEKRLLADISHPSQKYPHQRVYIIQINDYAYAVPYILNVEKQEIFLKTIYPSRIFTKTYLKGGEYEKKKK
ncbi:toxin [Patescibacteria group bacterium]|nr:toxin [Patescibacteria group bacterium]